MSLAKCANCEKLFNQIRRNICEDCYKEEEELVVKIQKFIKSRPSVNLPDIAEEMDVDEALVLKFIREKRIFVKSAEGAELFECKFCGRKLSNGDICVLCRQKLTARTSASKDDNGATPSREPGVGGKQSTFTESDRRDDKAEGSMIVKFRRK